MAGIGVVFSSGFFGFFAHAGFLSALRDRGILASGYAGASSGAIVAAMAASGMGDRDIQEILYRVRKEDFWDPDPWHSILLKAMGLFKSYSGYLRGEGFERLLKEIPVARIEHCLTPLLIVATNLTEKKETIFTSGDLVKAVQASGLVPMLFKPVEIGGSLYVDGGMVNKAPVKALADYIKPKTVIVHFITSENLEDRTNDFLKRRVAPWHIHLLSVNISRQEAYRIQLDMVRQQGIEVVEVRTGAPALGPNSLAKGPMAYQSAREETIRCLLEAGF